jgi:hypothetical protein
MKKEKRERRAGGEPVLRRPGSKVRGAAAAKAVEATVEETVPAAVEERVTATVEEERAGGGMGERVKGRVGEEGDGGDVGDERPGTRRVRVRVRVKKRGLHSWRKVIGKVAAELAVGGVLGWGLWRGGVAWGVFRGVKARELAEEAMASRQGADEEKAKALMDEAMVLDGDDVVVLRAAVDLYGERRDNAVMPALKKLLLSEESGEEDLERAARVALDWGRMELAPVSALQEWSESGAGGMTEGRMVVVARWMLMRGEREEAERRLRRAVEAGSERGEAELGLCEVLLSGGGEGVDEGLERLERLIGDGESELRVRQRGAELAARVMGVEGVREKVDEERLAGFRAAFAPLVARLDPEDVVECQLWLHAMELAAEPESRQVVFGRVMEEFLPVAEAKQLRIARWFLELGAWERVLGIYEGNPRWVEAEEWEALRLEALLESGDFEGAKAVMGRMTAGVSALKREVFRYRIAAGLGGGDELREGRMKLLRAAVEGDPEEVREAAEYAEGRGDRELAIGLYKVLEKDPEEEVLAKLEVAELQAGAVGGRAGAMVVLESLLSGWPRLEEVRNRLIRMRILEGRSGADDVAAAVEMAAGARGYAPFQVTAALARLVSGQSKEALELLEGNGGRNRREAEAVNPVVSAAVLAAGGREEDAKRVREAMGGRELTAGEKALLERWMPGEG